MTDTFSPPPQPTITTENPAFTRWVERRAVEVCADAGEAHVPDGRPCFAHVLIARADGLHHWRKAGMP